MVGTRNATDYGKQICVSFLQDLQALCPDVLVVSGLAYGINIDGYSQLFMMLEITTQGVFYGIGRTIPPAIISIKPKNPSQIVAKLAGLFDIPRNLNLSHPLQFR